MHALPPEPDLRRPRLAGVILVALCLPGVALAQAQAPNGFARLDADGNGQIDQSEFVALRQTMFARIDADADRLVTAAELDAARRALGLPANAAVWQQDSNGDGRLSLTECTAQTPGFARADRNGDGALSPAEFKPLARLATPFLPAKP